MKVGILYRPPFQTNFLERMNGHFYKLDDSKKETYILGDFNWNLYLNNKYVFENGRLLFRILSHMMHGNPKNFVYFFSLKQLISCPACTRCSSSR